MSGYTRGNFKYYSLDFCFSMRLPIEVEAILFRRSSKGIEYLVVKRVPEKGGFWQPITGGVEEGETKTEALGREVREETGIENIVKIIEDVHYFEFSDPHLYKEYVFGVEVSSNEKIVLDENEHSEFRWCSFQEALRLLKWEGNKEGLRKLNRILCINGNRSVS